MKFPGIVFTVLVLIISSFFQNKDHLESFNQHRISSLIDDTEWSTYFDNRTNVTFKYPREYILDTAGISLDISKRSYSLKRTIIDTLTSPKDILYTYCNIILRIFYSCSTFDECATEAGFYNSNGKWVYGEGMSTHQAISVKVGYWEGLKCYADTRIYSSNGYFGQADFLVISLIRHDKDSHSVCITFQSDGANDEDIFFNILNTFKMH